MTTLYLDRRNMGLKIQDGTLAVYLAGQRQTAVPLKMLDRIVVRADTEFSASLLSNLASQGIGLTIISGRKGEKVAHLVGNAHSDATRRLAQYRAHLDPAARMSLAREIVAAKLNNQARLAQRLLDQRPDQRAALTRSERIIRQAAEKLASAESLDALRGLEGAAASASFDALKAVLPPRLEFTGRNRRPPRDPVNAALSLAYTLAHSDAVQALYSAGLDPAIGMLHDPAWGRPSAAADLIEPLRPHLDEWVWILFRDRIIDQHHFSRDGDACLLIKNGRQRFYSEWEARAGALRRWLRQNAHHLARRFTAENK